MKLAGKIVSNRLYSAIADDYSTNKFFYNKIVNLFKKIKIN